MGEVTEGRQGMPAGGCSQRLPGSEEQRGCLSFQEEKPKVCTHRMERFWRAVRLPKPSERVAKSAHLRMDRL